MISNSEREVLHGQLIANFANAEDPEKACFSLFNDAQETFGFSDEFKKMATQTFPSFTDLKSSLTKRERVLAKLCFQKWKLLDHVDYNRYNTKQFDWGLIGKGLDWEILKWSFLTVNEARNLVIIDKSIHRYKQSLSAARYKAVLKLYPQYVLHYRFFRRIHNTYTQLKMFLDDLINKKELCDNEFCGHMLFVYNGKARPFTQISNDDSIVQTPSFNEQDFFGSWKKWSSKLSPLVLQNPSLYIKHPFNILLSISFVEFLKSTTKNKLKKCPYCEKFFMAKDTKRQRCYSKKCQQEYERVKKRKQRGDDPAKYY